MFNTYFLVSVLKISVIVRFGGFFCRAIFISFGGQTVLLALLNTQGMKLHPGCLQAAEEVP